MTDTLDIWLGGIKVGRIVRTPGEYNALSFDEGYRRMARPPILSLSFLRPDFTLRRDPRPTARTLPPFFANLLPEDKLREAMERHHSQAVRPGNDFDLLAALGPDLPGAVRALPADGLPIPSPASAASGKARFSLAGVQMKLSVMKNHGKEGGITLPVGDTDDGRYIAKFPSLTHVGLSENEFAMLALSEALGMDVPERELVDKAEFDGVPPEFNTLSTGRVLLVRRFDRGAAGERVHMEDFCQIFGQPPSEKYAAAASHDVAAVIGRAVSLDAAIEYVKRLAFAALTGNGDMHLKNWSLTYPGAGTTPALAPVYDVLSTVAYLPGDDLALSLGGTRSFKALTKDRWENFASRAALPRGAVHSAVASVVAQVNEIWWTLPERDVVPNDVLARIDDHVRMMSPILDSSFSPASSPEP
jgi:serine/threonine-protein kinase HipA